MSVPEAREGGERKRRRVSVVVCVVFVGSLVAVGVFAKNGWFPSTDPVSGDRTGWFGKKLPKTAASSWNPFAAPVPGATPQLSKSYIYAGSQLVAVEDANANSSPPSDLAVWRPTGGVWYVINGQTQAQTGFSWGQSGDNPQPGDYDGDGRTDFSIYREDAATHEYVWWINYSSTGGYTSVSFGLSQDLPAAADYDGDGRTDPAVFRPSTGIFHVFGSSAGYYTVPWGQSGDIPVSADYDGDGKADATVWRGTNTTFYSLNSSGSNGAYTSEAFGTNGVPVPGDYDGDGRADFALKSGNNWAIKSSARGSLDTIAWNYPSGYPVQNDFDGDGKVDVAVWDDSTGMWYIRQSSFLGQSNELRQVQWGQIGDIPVPAFYRR
jgi:hypothetical protein